MGPSGSSGHLLDVLARAQGGQDGQGGSRGACQGLTSIWLRVDGDVDNQPGPAFFVDQAGDQADPGPGKR